MFWKGEGWYSVEDEGCIPFDQQYPQPLEQVPDGLVLLLASGPRLGLGKLPEIRILANLPEIRILANLAGHDVGSVTGANLLNIGREFDLDPWTCSTGQLKEKYNFYPVPDEDAWRLPLLVKLLNQRMEMRACDEPTTTISELIDSLCYS